METTPQLNISQTKKVLRSNWFGFTQHLIGPTWPELEREKPRVTEVVMYRCNACDELHDWEDDAEECCASSSVNNANTNCPVCGCESASHREASDCCLWKDLDAPTRWAMADAVEAGSTWAEVLQSHIIMASAQ